MSPAPQTRIDAEQLDLMLLALRLPAIRALWKNFAERADTEGWPAARLLAALAEHELAERDRRRKERHLGEARLPPGNTGVLPFFTTCFRSRIQIAGLNTPFPAVAVGTVAPIRTGNLLIHNQAL